MFLISSIILVGNGLVGYLIYDAVQRLRNSEQLMLHTEQVLYQASNILSLSKDMQTSSRGFIITQDTRFLAPLDSARK